MCVSYYLTDLNIIYHQYSDTISKKGTSLSQSSARKVG